MTEILSPADARLLDDIRDAFEADDPMPASVTEAAIAAITGSGVTA